MRSIQDVGVEILEDNPSNFYIFCGNEYGIKLKYIEHLSDYYDGRCESFDSVDDVLNIMRTKHIIPLLPTLYIVRYDSEFVSKLSKKTLKYIQSLNIIGTIVLVYQETSDTKKLEKYLDEYCVMISSVSSKFMYKYLKSDFPDLSDALIHIVLDTSNEYMDAYLKCYALNSCEEPISIVDRYDILDAFGYSHISDVDMLKSSIIQRNFKKCMKCIRTIDSNKVYYTILNSMVEMENIMSNPFYKSNLRKYKKLWTFQDVYNMYQITYYFLKQSRSSYFDIESNIIFVLGLMMFQRIPSLEVFI